jgi:malonate-semialdehyde dehydrogenase (acetylating)/methylmalonate-semialdehyde dehydrogenase
MLTQPLQNFINGQWQAATCSTHLDIVNPATQEVLGQVPLSSGADVEQAARAAQEALPGWRGVPPGDRVQYLYRLKALLEQHREEVAQIITQECGKTLEEARGEMQRAIENVEVACGIPILMQGYISEDIARGVDELMLRQPVGVCAAITPFNFPGMIPFWFFPYSIACGNTYIIKPSERVPLTMQRVFQLIEAIELPKGVLNLVNGGKEAVDAILDHPAIRAISFVGSTQIARYIYSRATANGKRAQCQGGAKNPVVVLPDADIEMTTKIVADSAFGCAGQRCLAASLAITVGEYRNLFTEAIADAANQRVVGYGLDPLVQMGPVITPQSQARIQDLLTQGIAEGAHILVDGRNTVVKGYEQGNFLRPTIIDNIPAEGTIATTEIFGPALGLIHVSNLEEAISLINKGKYGNQASLFTSSGSAARKFRYEVEAGNVGINIGVAAPIAYFPFSGWKDSFFGDLHGQAKDAIDFFTQKKVVVERWPKEWSRKF